jgi:hypothetical protein
VTVGFTIATEADIAKEEQKGLRLGIAKNFDVEPKDVVFSKLGKDSSSSRRQLGLTDVEAIVFAENAEASAALKEKAQSLDQAAITDIVQNASPSLANARVVDFKAPVVEDKTSSKDNFGLAIGITFAVIAVLGLIALAIYYSQRKGKEAGKPEVGMRAVDVEAVNAAPAISNASVVLDKTVQPPGMPNLVYGTQPSYSMPPMAPSMPPMAPTPAWGTLTMPIHYH